MALLQPARTQEQWQETINKMRSAYGAPLPAEQVAPLAAYLTRVIAIKTGDGQTPTSTQEQPETATKATGAAAGAAIFAAHCAVCHQASGTGLPGVFPPLAGSAWVNGGNAPLIQILLHGVQGTLTVNGTRYNGAMPPFGDQLSDAEIAAVLTYIRSQWGNQAASVGTPLISAQRSATSTHSGPWSGDADLAKMK
jgi:mono/diheme cytochrome c family protein